ncbi:hypothetical protein SAMN04487945_3077 [Halobacterium jilantaiense]|uniref:Uncharacterized protein n=1 Tax=Halobacterium jilantaiense TaxID=355548 RepID=A0A1I0R370_9EURY|nr:hypothetical protein SAMN04487945_3077 [Halobacterium jilantaiense]
MNEAQKYPDGSVVHVFHMRANRDAYPSGCGYKLYHGATESNPPHRLADRTIR